ncbi:MAG TPA: sialidase family protein [Gemmatimonadaceae bacterium]|nr:sialidase family protein [Gemmatimonadaceae bacterium]
MIYLHRRLAIVAIAAAALLAGCSSHDKIQLSEPRTVSASTSVGAAPMFAVSDSGKQAMAWISAPDGGSDGRLYVSVGGGPPSELRDSLGPIEPHGESPPKIAYASDGSLDALYVVGKVAPGKRFPLGALRFARSPDGGKSWEKPVTVTDDSTFGSHNFHALHIARDGTIYAAWLDGRSGQSHAFATRSEDGGRTWAPNHPISTGEACPCCRTALASAPGGVVYAAWRAVLPGNIREIVVARSNDRGATWSEPVRVQNDQWQVDACPHAGPALAVDSQQRLHVTWWSGKEGAAGVFYARSDDGGKSFTNTTPLGTDQFSQPAHVQLVVGDSGVVAVAWDDGTLQTPRIALRISRDHGSDFAPTRYVSAEGRAASFPVLALDGKKLTVAWTSQSADYARTVAAERPDMSDPHASMGLPTVGESEVLVRSGELR